MTNNYRNARELIVDVATADGLPPLTVTELIALAQVHATLALVDAVTAGRP